MKKLIVIIALAAGTILMSCHASVRTPRTKTDVGVGSIQKVHPTEVNISN